MNTIIAIKRKAKSAYHSGGLRNRKHTAMKRKSASSEPEAASRPRKSPRSSEASLAIEKTEVEAEQQKPAKKKPEQDAKATHEPRTKLRRSERLRKQAKSGHQSVDIAHDDLLKLVDDGTTSNQEAESPEDPTAEPRLSEEQPDYDELDERHDRLLEADDRTRESDRQTEDPALEWERQQEIRAQCYREFRDEHPDDYTDGPMRVTLGSDGVKPCATLLLTFSFSTKARAALRAQLEFEKLQERTTRKTGVAMRFEAQIGSAIASHRIKLSRAEEEKQAQEEKQISLTEEINILERMLEESKFDRRCAQALLDSKASILRDLQAAANVELEEAFHAAQLLPLEEGEPESPIEERDLQQEYGAFCRKLEEEEDGVPMEPLDIGRDHTRPPTPSPDEQVKQEIEAAWWTAHDRLKQAHEAFDNKEWSRNQAKRAWQDAIKRGEESEADVGEKFDLPWLKHFQEITHELVDAEKEFQTAQANALEAGVVIQSQDNQSECSSTEPKATNPLEKTPDMPIFVNSNPKVSHWLDRVSASMSQGDEEEVTEADESEEDAVFFNESLSVVAKGLEREQIDQWEHRCDGETCEDKACQDEGSELGSPGEGSHEPAAREHGRWSKIRGVKELLAALKEPRHL